MAKKQNGAVSARTQTRRRNARRAARRRNLRVVAFTLWAAVLVAGGYMLGAATGPPAHAAFRPQASVVQGGVVGASRSGRCEWRNPHAKVLCVGRADHGMCRDALGRHPGSCWAFVGSDTEVIWNWRGRVSSS